MYILLLIMNNMNALSNGDAKPNFMISMLPLLLIFAAFYFLIIYPQLKSQKRHKSFILNLKNGDKVITNGGVHGTITGSDEKTVKLKIASNVVIIIDKNAIAGIDTSEQPEDKNT
ncbi:MAG: preprotein translocase subunit YajC [Candidatus Fischerbacteria bacterium RBG_13_37_8]|uniref:Preprotein translocase subunit YajC n=1 Tax=Candidatus Fischerbacteria bacterium RBG_13_37_8 TaxID=1817863 RepID=A0A1F5VJU3_9BACT|nr:MAG: preprotein translocase subunit YajC [Candidatus Fischerbacteria bacterium RBG_13_37_8]